MIQKSLYTIAKVFFDEPSKNHSIREISVKAALAHTSVRHHLAILKQGGIIGELREKRGKRIFPLYHTNFDSKKYKEYKILSNLLQLRESGLIVFLKDTFLPKAIILFGSYARGEDTEESDIDIFIDGKPQEVDLTKFEKVLQRNVQLHCKEQFKSYPKELKNNIINGVVLEGYLEVF